jgi:hypothetical protein
MERHRRHFDDEDGPVLPETIAYDELFAEPLYQLFRLQVLANEMERARELGADCVSLVVAASGRNHALAGELRRWPTLLRRPDRFAVYDTDLLLAAGSVASDHYRQRYGGGEQL